MAETVDPVVVLTEDECWARLRTQELGRLVTHVGDVIDIFPVNFVADGGDVLFRTAEGSKLFELTVNDEVLFEVDDHTEHDAWSVIVRGRARVLTGSAEIEHADALPLRPWIPTLKRVYVRVTPNTLSGRAFHRGAEPSRDGLGTY